MTSSERQAAAAPLTDEDRRAFDAAIAEPLRRLRVRWRVYAAQSGVVRVWLLVVLSSLVQLFVDRWLRLTPDQRATFNIALTGAWSWWAWRHVVRPVTRPIADEDLARLLDRANPELRDLLSAAVQFAAGRVGDPASNSPELAREAVREACVRGGSMRFDSILNHRRARQRVIEFSCITAGVLAAFVIDPVLMGTWFKRNWLLSELPWPQRTYLVPDGFTTSSNLSLRRVPRGDALNLVVRVRGEIPPIATIHWRSASGQRGEEEMRLVARQRFEFDIDAVTEDLTFHLVGGDERTRDFTVQAVDRPHVTRTLAHITPPEYTGEPATTVERQSVLDVPRGGVVLIEAWVNKPLASAQFVAPDGKPIPCELRDDVSAAGAARGGANRIVSVQLAGPAAGAGTLELLDGDGLKDRNPLKFTFRILPDKPPAVRLTLNGVGELITPQAEISADVQVNDGYGISRCELLLRKNADEPRNMDIGRSSIATAPVGGGPALREFKATRVIEVAALAAQPGDRIRASAVALDNDPLGPNMTTTQGPEWRVVSREDFATEMARREFALRQEFERQITAQRLLNDTLDRLFAEMNETAPDNRVAQRLAGLARQQEQIARRSLVIRDQFVGLLSQMWTNKVATSAIDRRITDAIVTPLAELTRGRMTAAAEGIQAARRGAGVEKRQVLRQQQAEILRYMQTILANMLRWEGYQEAVSMLREIIGEQAEIRGRTMKAIEQQLEDILNEAERVP